MPLKKAQKSILNRYPEVRVIADLPRHVITDVKKLSDYKNIEDDINRYLMASYDDY